MTGLEPRPDTGHADPVLVRQLADAIRAHVVRTGETERQLAIRIGMKHQNLYELLRRADDPTFDVGRLRLERLAAAVGLTWKLEPAPGAASPQRPRTP